MKIRVQDIAKKAGVSPATVSNALNNRPGVGKELADQIKKFAEEMGYAGVKSTSRVTQKKDFIRMVILKRHGLVVMDTQFFAELVESIERECQIQKLELVITNIHMRQMPDYADRIRSICAEECAGVIVLATEMLSEDLTLFDGCVSPLLALDNLFENEQIHSVSINNSSAGYQAANMLYAAGHRRINYITSTVDFSNMRYRRKGYEAAMCEHDLPVTDSSVWQVTPTLSGAYQDMLALLKNGRTLPTAFFACNDIMAIGCMRALNEYGYSVPGDISIIGMDDLQICECSSPRLSTVRVFRKELGVVAVRTLLRLSPQLKSPCIIKSELSVDLIMRDSVSMVKSVDA